MSLVLTRNQYLRQHWRLLRKRDPESGPIWEKFFLPKTLRSPKLYGWYHNSPYAQWNNYSYFALEKRTLSHTVAQFCFKRPEVSRFADLLKLAEISVLREISDQGPYTLFVPSNDALARLPGGWEATLCHFESNPGSLRKFLRSHIVRGNRRVRSVRTLQVSDPYINLEGRTINFKLTSLPIDQASDLQTLKYTMKLAGSSLEAAHISQYDFRAHNGYVSIIDGVLGFSPSDERRMTQNTSRIAGGPGRSVAISSARKIANRPSRGPKLAK